MISYFWGEREVLFVNQNIGEGESLVSIFNSSDTSSEARQMNRRRILLINLLNRCQRFDSDAHHLTLKDTDLFSEITNSRLQEEDNRLLF